MRETILVFGGTSFIGASLIEKLVTLGYEVIVTCRPDSAKIGDLYSKFQNNIKYIELDICNAKSYINSLGELDKCDYLYLASWEGTNKRDDVAINARSADGLLQCLQYILDRYACRKIIQLGSQAEYGCPTDVVTEETVCKPVTAYGKEKLRFYKMADLLCKQKNTFFIEYRLHSVFGKARGGVLNDVVSQLEINKCCYMDTDCNQIFDFVYIDDCVDALLLGMQENLHYGIYNISSGNGYTLKQYLEKIKTIVAPDCKIVYGTCKARVSPNFYFDSMKFRNATGWVPKYSFEDGIKDMIS